MTGNTTVVLGSAWGDESKGKMVDVLLSCGTIPGSDGQSTIGDFDYCVRACGGDNAGHTVKLVDANGVKQNYDFHLLPSGLISESCISIIGSGCVCNLDAFFSELETLESKGLMCRDRLKISSRAHIIFPFHRFADSAREQELSATKKSIGTTGKGIGPAYSTKASRSGIRIHHLVSQEEGAWDEFVARFTRLVESRKKRYGEFDINVEEELNKYKQIAEKLRPFVVDSVDILHKAVKENKKILVEGANALMLDLDFGTYPYVTSSATSIGGVCTGLGIPPRALNEIIGVVKAYTTRVGGGPFPTELLDKTGEHLQDVGAEYGVTTGRKRRCGWLDLFMTLYSTRINDYTSLNVTKLDVLDQLPELRICTGYKYNGKSLTSYPEDLYVAEKCECEYKTFEGWMQDTTQCKSYDELPQKAKEYLQFIEDFLQVPVRWVGVGPSRESMLVKRLN